MQEPCFHGPPLPEVSSFLVLRPQCRGSMHCVCRLQLQKCPHGVEVKVLQHRTTCNVVRDVHVLQHFSKHITGTTVLKSCPYIQLWFAILRLLLISLPFASTASRVHPDQCLHSGCDGRAAEEVG